ncbi:MAG TPA: TAT-variant-translocated molybdopterin oxidoreductase [Terriglobales bacterium]|nr:TAT-variant-translocated molybdopterin oxidoreductase [Terriglobales bacterium]
MGAENQDGKSPDRPADPPCAEKKRLELAEVRARLEAAKGPRYWRTLEELSASAGFDELMQREFPRQASEWLDPVTRRGFLKLMGASMALAGLAGCTRQPLETIVPYVRQPEDLVLGKPLYFATAIPLSGIAAPVLVKSNEGRPTKVEGNPEHPASLGACDVFAQASVLSLYDPDRAQTVTYLGEPRSWGTLLGALQGPLATQKALKGAGLRILTETVTSPTLAGQLQALLAIYPQAKWHRYEPVNRDNARAGALAAFGECVDTQYKLENADVILSLDADILSATGLPGSVRYSRDFAARRRPESAKLNRLYAVESTPSNTGAKADHRLVMRSSEVEGFARALVQQWANWNSGVRVPAAQEKFLVAVANDLQMHHGRSVVIPGEGQPPAVHQLAHSLNHALGNVGATVIYTDPVEANPVDQMGSLRELVDEMNAGKVDLLLILGGNPVFTAPADLGFAAAMNKVELRIQLSPYDDETTEFCQWHIPESHPLEAWSDLRAYDGTVSIVQPLIAPLYETRSAHEVVTALAGQAGRSGYELVRAHWQGQHPGADFEEFWRRSVHDGFVAGTAFPAKPVTLKNTALPPAPAPGAGIEIVFRPDPTIYDGRFANNGWLQELPKPILRTTWDNVALMSPATAQAMGIDPYPEARRPQDVVEIRYGGRQVTAPAWVVPGHPDDCVTVHFGYGRRRAGRSGSNAGFNAYALRTSAAPHFAPGATLVRTGEQQMVACTQTHQLMEGRHQVRVATLAEYEKDPDFAQKMVETPPAAFTLYEPVKYDGYAWGMSIDLNSCVGCNACVVACQAENNSPVVGREQVIREREMHWIRLDTYFEGDAAGPRTYFQPVPCMQCENAPCEVVCPVGATNHSSEGLNDMVYNRCVGTRYCSNNCPYKVRRFNFFLYSDYTTPSLELLHNPDVTVRSRGVMEKCTYCVQRINHARIHAEEQDRKIRDGEIQTACQQACPAEAIVFGDINDQGSRVVQRKADARNYGLLADLNTRPRTTYTALVRNPNPELEKEETS